MRAATINGISQRVRQELRRQCLPTDALFISPDLPEPVTAEVSDVSSSGLRVSLRSSIQVGASVRIAFTRLALAGIVRYCEPGGKGTFDVGVQIKSSTDRP